MNFKFFVRDKKTNEEFLVFDITYDHCGFPQFLIHDGKSWHRKSAKFFKPVDPADWRLES